MQPVIVMAKVTAHDPPRRVQVTFGSTGQQPSFTVQMGLDYGDALRVRQKPLPGIGTWGLVAFPRGDYRNGIWITSYLPSQMDALHYAGTKTDPFIDYEAHFSGYWSLLDGVGQQSNQWPDGSFFNVSSGIPGAQYTLPTVYRNTVVAQKQTRIPYTRADRIPHPPSGYGFAFVHQTGTNISVGPGGNTMVNAGPGLSITMTANGATFTMDGSGNVTIISPGTLRLQGRDVQIHGTNSMRYDANGNGTEYFTAIRNNYVVGSASNTFNLNPPEIP